MDGFGGWLILSRAAHVRRRHNLGDKFLSQCAPDFMIIKPRRMQSFVDDIRIYYLQQRVFGFCHNLTTFIRIDLCMCLCVIKR